ncbi:UNVERIFIED_CONTAM: protein DETOXIFICATION 53 [Sesamum latifolium]|uniref:Protein DETOXIFICATION 53 n=1 Tax=Sesamum latifolium TaxID=2727402 RepID=A0AAW2XFV9_9LAMI
MVAKESLAYYTFHGLKQVAEKLASLAKIACPIIITSLLMYSKSFVSMLFLGHLGDIALSGGSLSISFANITGYSVLKGLAMGMEPICYQAYGAKRWAIMTKTYRKTLILLLAAVFPICLLWLNMEPILLWLGQDENIAKVAKIYIKYSIPDLIAQAHFHPLRTFLRTQNINRPLTISVIGAMLLHCPINYFLVVYLNLGVRGVALASAWNTLNINFGLLVYLFMSKTSLRPWDGGIASIFSEGWHPLLALAGPSVLSVCLEWWCYEILLLLCSLLSNPQVGHELGADQPKQAQQTSIVGFTLAALWGILAFLFTTALRDVWGRLFTCDPMTLGLTSSLPVAALSAFKFNMGFVGLWFGMAAAQVSCTCMMVCTLIYTDWKQQATRAKELTQENEDSKNDLEAPLLS